MCVCVCVCVCVWNRKSVCVSAIVSKFMHVFCVCVSVRVYVCFHREASGGHRGG